ncbi:MAG: DUF3024 domain-containing protein [Proteobacteria bacterium]|nr:DUF3024 domain-containing protein [Pseudomonadota bacterium]
MALSELQRTSIERLLARYCAPVAKPEVAAVLRYGFQIGPSDVVIYEERPAFRNPSEWHRHDIAKMRWVATTREWRLFCQLSDLKWHGYEPRPSAASFDELLDEVEADPTGIFWG